jgi:hypothetical protein
MTTVTSQNSKWSRHGQFWSNPVIGSGDKSPLAMEAKLQFPAAIALENGHGPSLHHLRYI